MTEPVAGPACRNQGEAVGERVGGDDPLQGGGRGVQASADRGQRNGHDRGVQQGHERPDEHNGNGPPAMAAAARAPGESLLTAIRRDYAERIAAGGVTLGPPTATFARMVQNSHVLTSRGREIADLTEQALGDVIAAETGADDPQQRIVAAQLVLVHRVLFAEGARRILAGQPRDEICQVLAAAARQAFDLLEPSLGGYAARA